MSQDDVIDVSYLLTPDPLHGYESARVMSQDDVLDDVIDVSYLLTPDPLRGYESGSVHVCVSPLLTPTPSGL